MAQTLLAHEVNHDLSCSAHPKERSQVQASIVKSPNVDTKATALETGANKTTTSSPLRQCIPAYLLACLAIASYSLTVCYALGTTGLRHLPFTSLDPSKTLTVLRTLSEVTSVLLWPLISLCTDRALWMMVARRDGTRLSTFLSLHPGSGPWAWIQIIIKNVRGGRSLSWVKLIISLIPPAMGVALLSQVDIGLYFDDGPSFPVAAGIGDFNASYASDFAEIAPVYMASDFSALLQNREISWDVPVVSASFSSCTTSSDLFAGNACGSGYFLHGGLKLVTPWPTENTDLPTDPIYTLHSVRGLQLDFTTLAPEVQFQDDQDCLVLGTDNSAIQICISQHSPNAVNAKYVHCPIDLAISSSCLKNTTWQASHGWTTTMTSYTRTGTVHFSRTNLSAIAISNLSPSSPNSISAPSLLSIYNTTLSTSFRTFGLASTTTSSGQFISFVSSFLTFATTSTPTSVQATSNLHNFLAMPLYYFQPTFLSPYTLVPSPDVLINNIPQDQRGLYTTASLSSSYYGLRVARWSSCVYTVGIGLLILLCILVLVVGSGGFPAVAKAKIPDMTPWSFVDYAAECDIGDVGGGDGNKIGDVGGDGDIDTVEAMRKVKKAMITGDWRSTNKAVQGMRVRLRTSSN